MKKETLEEAAQKYANDWEEMHSTLDSENMTLIAVSKIDFIAGANWQAERMYSEEDVMDALHSVELKYNRDFSKIYEGVKEWFEQFKKK